MSWLFDNSNLPGFDEWACKEYGSHNYGWGDRPEACGMGEDPRDCTHCGPAYVQSLLDRLAKLEPAQKSDDQGTEDSQTDDSPRR